MFPVICVSGLLIWSYYAAMVHMLFKVPGFPNYKWLLAFLLSISWTFTMWSYFAVIRNGPGSPLDIPMLVVNEYIEDQYGNVQNDDSELRPPPLFIKYSQMCKRDGGFRFCSKCKCWKPDRSHHCSSCGKCILKMDHHCPWFGECIGYRNYRFFLQFLIWSDIYLITITWTSSWTIWGFFVLERWPLTIFSLHILFLMCIGSVFTISMIVFTIFTIYQLINNKTTIESYEFQRIRNRNRNSRREIQNVFDLGWKSNWCEVMGNKWWQWLIPIQIHYQPSDPEEELIQKDLFNMGICYPVNIDLDIDASLVERLSREIER
jgi:palmitoyltransferase